MPSPRGRRRRASLLAASAAALAVTAFGALPGAASAASAPASSPASSGTATAVAGQVHLDVKLLQGVLGGLHITGPNGLDIPLADLSLGEADAPNASGDSANFTNSVVRLRDNLISTLHLPGPEANLIDADAVSGTARVINGPGGYTQAYATVANLRLFLPLLNLPGSSAANGILKVDLVSAQATCVPGQKPTASAKMPTTINLLGRDIPVPLTGEVKLNVPGVANIDVQLAPTTTIGGTGASSAVEAQIKLNALNLASVSGGITLAKAACTTPAAATGSGSGSGTPTSQASSSHSAPGSGTTATTTAAVAAAPTSKGTSAAAAPAALNEKSTAALAHTGASGSLMPIAAIAVVLVLGGGALLVFLRKKAAGLPPQD
ncbi:LPXTG-motif cell wall anchor domain protein [Catenulispora acidiphila DSM 44928]|uniref:LPXTG-motif cell wall anchor domain protein n=1 Tax=Catenulispora acidiphila (strain DSM 44928 / JCM 14897 / NBRC 102108 / NRRL B-24433 / ID139908) TaxID=479433 RepID=C7Q257_CATAD|nr:LPXTG cell wall anchor domain-containing protein [Catenulispora acidiphila]ACU77594.1 LPXTG-motif cell wall anchor domain protein [Catenulispora acidiphila DSM 44928]